MASDPIKILIVDDDEEALMALERLLEEVVQHRDGMERKRGPRFVGSRELRFVAARRTRRGRELRVPAGRIALASAISFSAHFA